MAFLKFGDLPGAFQTGDFISVSRLRSGTITAREIILAGGTNGIIRSQNYDGAGTGWIIRGDGSASFGSSVTIFGDLISGNWDGTNPANLATKDGGATAGYYLDSSVGAAQFMGDLWVDGDITLNANLLSDNYDGSGIPDAAATAGFALEGTTGDFQFLGTGRIDGALTIGGALTVEGATTLNTTLTLLAGGIFRTKASGERIEITEGANDRINFYEAQGLAFPGSISGAGFANGTQDWGTLILEAPSDAGTIQQRAQFALNSASPASTKAFTFSVQTIHSSTTADFSGPMMIISGGNMPLAADVVKIDTITGFTGRALTILDGSVTELMYVDDAGIKANSGTEGEPGYGFVGDTDTGPYRVTTNIVGIAVGGKKMLEVANGTAGILNIGTSDSAVGNSHFWHTKPAGNMYLTFGGTGNIFLRSYVDPTYTNRWVVTTTQIRPYTVGSVSAPPFAFQGFGNYGMFQGSAQIQFAAAGTVVARFSSTEARIPDAYNQTGTDTHLGVTSTGLLRRQTSAAKYKKRIKDASVELASIELRPVSYYLRVTGTEDNKTRHFGLIADEVAIAMPDGAIYHDGEVEDFSDRAVLAVALAKIARLEDQVRALQAA